jgi:hypothetical protein
MGKVSEELVVSVDMKRVNIRVAPHVYEWFKDKSARTGVSMSSLMYLALEGHIQQQSIVDVLPMMQRQLEELQDFAKANPSLALPNS